MPHQRRVWDVGLEVQSEENGDPFPGEWAYEDLLQTIQRQTGKTTGLRPVVIHRLGMLRQARVFMTAQNRDKARRRWMDATDDLMASEFGAMGKRKIGVGHEELRWHATQSVMVPFAPNEEAMHGETPDLVAIDELWAFEYDEAQDLIAAYRPGFTTKDAQVWKMSTAGTSTSWWLNTSRRAGRRSVEEGRSLGRAYFEWGLPDRVRVRGAEVELEELTDAELVQACIDHHPGLGHNLRPQSLWGAWDELADDPNRRPAFLRAYGNRTAEDLTNRWQAVTEAVWLGATSPDRIPGDAEVSLGVEVDEDRRCSTVVAAFRVHGRMVTEVLRHDLGTRWVAPYVAGVDERQRVRAIGGIAAGPSRDVMDELGRSTSRRASMVELNLSDFAAACVRHADELAAGTWVHDGNGDLTAAARTARWRNVGRSRAWDTDGEPVTALSATSIAGWATDHAPEPAKPLPPFRML